MGIVARVARELTTSWDPCVSEGEWSGMLSFYSYVSSTAIVTFPIDSVIRYTVHSQELYGRELPQCWNPPQSVPSCLLFHLKEIEFKFFEGQEDELKLSDCFLSNAKSFGEGEHALTPIDTETVQYILQNDIKQDPEVAVVKLACENRFATVMLDAEL
ncbi:hypothetical protein RHMOL_Rhmol01G0063800 [Rhododendron molle]|uniref:Uncharacterized protein n=1 Tax=Rhododendron molle TaxID=49168 RepID=A0ACC0Q042_RHOML|nr:hypothetical protein RHMOL_Rhmol01G0063800 [Rhododendron molle]